MTSPSPDELIPTRSSLLDRLQDWEDHEGWQRFFDTYWRLIYSVALRSGLTESEAEEVVQETVVAVARRMPTFRYDATGSFKAWLLRITHRRIVDQFRKRPPWSAAADPVGDEPAAAEEAIAVQGSGFLPAWEDEWQRNLLEAALSRVRSRVSPRQYQIFDLYVVKDWPVREVARTLGVSATQVYLARHRVSRLVRREMRLLESGPLPEPTPVHPPARFP